MIKLKTKFSKFVAQYKFRPTLVSFTKISEFAREFENDFEEWQAPKSSEVTLYSPGKKVLLTLGCDNITFSCENSDGDEKDITDGIGFIKKAYKYYLTNLNVERPKRIGFRVSQVFQTDFSFSDLADLMYQKFLTEKTLKSLSIQAEDLAFVLDGVRNNMHNKVRLGPLRLNEAANKIQNSFDFDTTVFGDGSLFMDIDVFLNEKDIIVSESVEVIDKLKNEHLELTNGFIDILKDAHE